ncbi:TPA: flagellar motor switch protein FliG [Candidatus Sumerlaeota bacterium]|nr:flagellar motor switch protein FliG [Candidatus Sumerlaeota bacterium]
MAGERKLSGTERAAILLLTVREDVAQEIMKILPTQTLHRVTGYAAMLRDVPVETIVEIKREFCEKMRNANALQLGNTREVIRELLSGFMSPEEVEKLTLDMSPDGGATEGLEALKWMAPDSIAAFLRNEHPQTIALVLAHLEPSHSAQVLQKLRPSIQPEVIMRLSNLDRVAPTVLQDLNKVLKEELITSASASSEVLGGLENVAEIMNNMDKNSETSIFESIEEINPSLVEEIRELMFTFEDLQNVDNRGMQELSKQISNEHLVLALKTASDVIKQKFFANISSRAADLIKEELEVMGPVKLSDVEAAQQEIVKVARRLADEGKIMLAGKGGAEALV